jgi:hypothetical protein
VTGFDSSDVTLLWSGKALVSPPSVSIIVAPRVKQLTASGSAVSTDTYSVAILADDRFPVESGCDNVTLTVHVQSAAARASTGLDSLAASSKLVTWAPGTCPSRLHTYGQPYLNPHRMTCVLILTTV